MTSGAEVRRVAPVVVPVCAAGFAVAAAAVAALAWATPEPAALLGIGASWARRSSRSAIPSRWTNRRAADAHVRVRGGRDHPVRLGRRCGGLLHGAGGDAAARAQAPGPGRVQCVTVRPLRRDCGWLAGFVTGSSSAATFAAVAVAATAHYAVNVIPHHRRRLEERRPTVLSRSATPRRHRVAVHDHGLRRARDRRALAAVAAVRDRARRAAADDLALPAVDAPGAQGDPAGPDRSATGSATTATSRSDSGESSTTRRSKDAGFLLSSTSTTSSG